MVNSPDEIVIKSIIPCLLAWLLGFSEILFQQEYVANLPNFTNWP